MNKDTEYWMIYRGPGFFAVVWFVFSPPPLHPLQSPPLPSESLTGDIQYIKTIRKRDLLTGIGNRMGRGRSQIKRQRESLVLCKSFNILCENSQGKRGGEECANLCQKLWKIGKRREEELLVGGKTICPLSENLSVRFPAGRQIVLQKSQIFKFIGNFCSCQ